MPVQVVTKPHVARRELLADSAFNVDDGPAEQIGTPLVLFHQLHPL
jgi:hypothetical protein